MGTAFLRKINIELLAWPIGLLLLFLLQPDKNELSLCLFKNAGLSFCPGCGLGHGIHYLLHGQWQEALRHHRLSPLVTAVLIYRTAQLARFQYLAYKH